MERKIFLEKNRSKFSVNKANKMNIDLDTKSKLMQNSGILGNFSLFEQYNAERDACNKFRMIFTVNPVCSNVLFNMQTEIVQNEGSDSPLVLSDVAGISPSAIKKADGTEGNSIVNTTSVTRRQAIRDTEYSHPQNGGFVYHCGTDIFNNHMLRSDGFAHVNKISSEYSRLKEYYNTIEDYLRDGNGKLVENNVNPSSMNPNDKIPLHLYTMDTTLSLKRAYLTRIKEKDGWIGFTNPGTIDIPNSEEKDDMGNDVLINTMLANNKPCEFIDMYPDRSLYSFIPKYNKFRDRIEKNWDYCITYPYAKDAQKINEVCGGKCEAIRADFELGHNASSVPILMCRSLFKHTLKSNSYIALYYYDGGEFKKFRMKVRVLSVGNYDGSDTDRYFTIRVNDVIRIYDKLTSGSIYYKKISNGSECDYYFRKYKKLTHKNGDGTSRDLRSEIGKLAYSENIYGDRLAEVVFTDDIDVEGLYDHMGRPVSELYFTVTKRNAGHEAWYGYGNYGSPEVEFSHCFGKLTSGLDFGPYSAAQMDYNVRYLNNVMLSGATLVMDVNKMEVVKDTLGDVIYINYIPATLEDDISMDNMGEFYGDVVEFDSYMYEEREISPVLHRFNTAQREKVARADLYPLYYDKMVHDDYDLNADGESVSFRVNRTNFSKVKKDDDDISIPCNIRPEGYFYNPHTKIRVRESDTEVTRVRAKSVNYGIASGKTFLGNTIIGLRAPSSYNFLKWDYIAFCDEGGLVNGVGYSGITVWGRIEEVNGLDLEIKVEGTPFGTDSETIKSALIGENRRFRAYYSTDGVPLYASFNKSTQEFAWRGITSPSKMTKDMELFDTTFANGRFYIEKGINLFVRRQDPFGEFGLSYARHDDGRHPRNPMEYFNVDSEYLDLSQIYNFYNNLDNVCF